MFPKCVERLAAILAVGLRPNKARAKCMTGIVIIRAYALKQPLFSRLFTTCQVLDVDS